MDDLGWGGSTVASRSLDRELFPRLAIPATQGWVPTPHRIVWAQWKIWGGKEGEKKTKTKKALHRKKPLRFSTLKCAFRLWPRVLGAFADLCYRWLPWAHWLPFDVNSVKLHLSTESKFMEDGCLGWIVWGPPRSSAGPQLEEPLSWLAIPATKPWASHQAEGTSRWAKDTRS